jgi:hypothetical protein
VLADRGVVIGARAAGASRMKDHLFGFHPVMVECGDEGVLLDLDTPEDYRRLTERAALP